ncbi:histidine phosphatase family protein [Paracoccus benzoatiresistens]|uniref:Histidine phosphatase family protein n=1 Tax=Paracoccus benzoatiresistens TaxID=2997341 RepID=A0ABT4J7T8_9RHOB|nr:histidine phosphatase family protein [Paracoccus sp. EF6]MCZ0963180.1 histidine phosphatase family protein [Paracoccus sp. EF6]
MILPKRPFCLIRHGQTGANRDGIIAGRTEARLTDRGRDAARALADHPWPCPVALFTSPQDRARETASLAFPSQTARVVEDLRERDWGIFEGRPVAELPPRTSTPEGGESWHDMLARIAAALGGCMVMAGDALPVIVAHSGVIRAARALTGQDFTGPSAPNTTPLLYTVVSGGWREQPLTASSQVRLQPA